jgi:hypothetical protein
MRLVELCIYNLTKDSPLRFARGKSSNLKEIDK